MPETTNKIPVACFGPIFSDQRMEEYKTLIGELEQGQLKDHLTTLYNAIIKWWSLPESSKTRPKLWEFRTAEGGTQEAPEQPLDEEFKKQLHPLVPWMSELNAMEPVLDTLPNGLLRNCAYHLLWACKELTLDREPMTLEKLEG